SSKLRWKQGQDQGQVGSDKVTATPHGWRKSFLRFSLRALRLRAQFAIARRGADLAEAEMTSLAPDFSLDLANRFGGGLFYACILVVREALELRECLLRDVAHF